VPSKSIVVVSMWLPAGSKGKLILMKAGAPELVTSPAVIALLVHIPKALHSQAPSPEGSSSKVSSP
jgi:hypothetical protein